MSCNNPSVCSLNSHFAANPVSTIQKRLRDSFSPCFLEMKLNLQAFYCFAFGMSPCSCSELMANPLLLLSCMENYRESSFLLLFPMMGIVCSLFSFTLLSRSNCLIVRRQTVAGLHLVRARVSPRCRVMTSRGNKDGGEVGRAGVG